MSEAISDRGLSFAAHKISQAEAPDKVLYWECLARLTDARGVVHDAGEFAPYLEFAGTSFDLDVRMLDQILSVLAANPSLVLGCNISAANLSAADCWAQIFNKIGHQPELASRLVLEITETYPLVGEGIDRLALVQALGCRLAIDNFGTGLATPARLLSVPADIVKIDASFVRDIRTPENGQNSLYHLVGLAASVAPIVVVQGIEKQEQLDAARAARATHVQGFLFGKPAPLPRFATGG